jgi:hypothetical protein
VLGRFIVPLETFHHGLQQFFGVSEFLSDHAQIHRGNCGIALTSAVDAMLADENQRVGDAVKRDCEAAAVPEARAFFPLALLGIEVAGLSGLCFLTAVLNQTHRTPVNFTAPLPQTIICTGHRRGSYRWFNENSSCGM